MDEMVNATSAANAASLPDSWVERIFRRLENFYGAKWVDSLGDHLGEIHLHDNHGTADEHLPVGEGTFPFKELMRLLSIESPVSPDDLKRMNTSELTDQIYQVMIESYNRKVQIIAKQAFPVIKEVYEHKSHIYQNIVVPITDGRRVMNVIANLKKAYDSLGKEVALSIDKGVTLATIDEAWKEHLREMDDLKQSVQNATYEQKEVALAAGDVIVLYTDGVTEAVNNREEMFEIPRLMEVILRTRSQSAREMVMAIIDAVNAFSVNQPQYDDITLMVVKVR